jgi:hypothetical protein
MKYEFKILGFGIKIGRIEYDKIMSCQCLYSLIFILYSNNQVSNKPEFFFIIIGGN